MSPDEAVDVIARHLIARSAETGAENGDWDFYAEIAEHDWEDVARRVAALAPFPDGDAVASAEAFLAERAEK